MGIKHTQQTCKSRFQSNIRLTARIFASLFTKESIYLSLSFGQGEKIAGLFSLLTMVACFAGVLAAVDRIVNEVIGH